MDYVLNLSAVLAHILATHPKHKSIEERLELAEKLLVPDLLILELQLVVLSARYPELDGRVFAQVLETLKTDPAIRLLPLTPEVAEEHSKWFKRLSFFDAYHAAFSHVHKTKLLTTDKDFKPFDFAEVV